MSEPLSDAQRAMSKLGAMLPKFDELRDLLAADHPGAADEIDNIKLDIRCAIRMVADKLRDGP
ncbi:MAG: hypothetical protein ACPGVG_18960 [Mycobacterium sp.]